ncbi:MAG: tetratricopeptide repeat protein [Chloroflexi bacterium]|nr:tetratricopeptide repeat protein [Chloroflexota bacterium]
MNAAQVSSIFPSLNIPEEALAAYHAGKAAENRQQYQEAVGLYDRALVSEASAIFLSRVLDKRGNCYWLLGQYEAAARDFQQALEISNDPGQRARSRARLGEVADARGWYDEALQLYQAALEEGMAAGDVLAIGRSQRGLGIVYRRQGNAEKAIAHLTQALAAFRQSGEALEQARVLTSLGRTRYARGEYQQAITAHTEALHILENLGDRWRIALSLNDIGECHQALYDMEVAIDYHGRALHIAEEENAEVIMPDIKRNMGLNLVGCGQYAEGITYLDDALATAERFGNHEQIALILYALSQAHINQGDLAQAEETVRHLSKVANELVADRYQALAAFRRGDLLLAKGELSAATAELQAAMLAAQNSLDRGVLWKLHATMSYVVEDPAIAAIHRHIAADFIQQTIYPLQDSRLKDVFVHAPPVMAVLAAVGIEPESLVRRN